jgi:hypothetical protein
LLADIHCSSCTSKARCTKSSHTFKRAVEVQRQLHVGHKAA